MYRAHIRVSPTHPCLQPLDALRWLLPLVAELHCPVERAEYVLKRAKQSMNSERARLGQSRRRPQGESHGQALQRWQEREEARLERRLEGLRVLMERWEEEEEMQRQRAREWEEEWQEMQRQRAREWEEEKQRQEMKRQKAQALEEAQVAAQEQVQAGKLTLVVAGNSTGYYGVALASPGKPKPYRAQLKRGGKMVNLGNFATADEAARCVALSPEGGRRQRGRQRRRS